MIYIESKKKNIEKLKQKYPNAIIADITSKAKDSLIKLSPFYPHGDIPIPFSNGHKAKSVEGVWQGLKVFEKADIDIKSFENSKMKDIKRTSRKFGKTLGHRKGIDSSELLNYIDARFEIYLPTYLWVLENKVVNIIKRLGEAAKQKDIILLDYETNLDVLNSTKPLSHAYLVKSFLEQNYPDRNSLNNVSIKNNSVKEKKRKTKTKTINNNQKELF